MQPFRPLIQSNFLEDISFEKNDNSRYKLPFLGADTLTSFMIMATLKIVSLLSTISKHSDENKIDPLRNEPSSIPTNSQQPKIRFPVFQKILKGIILFAIFFSLPGSALSKEIASNSQTSQFSFQSQASISDIRTLSIGKVLRSLRLNTDSILLSPDSQLAFVILKVSGSLKVLDISDHQNPITIGSLERLKPLYSYQSYRFKKLALSADGKTLFATNHKFLEIIDVSEPQSPFLKQSLEDEKFSSADGLLVVPEYCIPTIALSSDEKTLYVAGNGLQIFDIANISQTSLLFSFRVPKIKTSLALLPESSTLLYANETLEFYDVSDPTKPKLKHTYSSTADISFSSLILSKNAKTVYLAGLNSESYVVLEEIDISKPESPISLNQYELNGELSQYVSPSIIAFSPHETNLILIKQKGYIPAYPLPMGTHPQIEMIGFDLLRKQIMISEPKDFFADTTSLALIPSTDRVIANANDHFQIIQLFQNYPNTKTFCLANNSREDFTFPTPQPVLLVRPSEDGNTLFTLDSASNFAVWNFTDQNSPPQSLNKALKLDLGFTPGKLIIMKNFALIHGAGFIYEVNISDPMNISPTGFITQIIQPPFMSAFISSPKDPFLFYFTATINQDGAFVKTWMADFTNMAIKEQNVLQFSSYNLQNLAVISRNGVFLYVFAKNFEVYDVSKPLTPMLISSTRFVSFKGKLLLPMTPSADDKALFVLSIDQNDYAKLAILDVSDKTAVKFISVLELPKITSGDNFNPFIISRDGKTGFLVTEQNLLVINFKSLASPVVIGMIPFDVSWDLLSKNKISSFFLSPDEKIAYLANNEGRFTQLNLEMNYALFLPQEKLELGKKYADSLMLLNSSSDGNVLLMDSSSEYKINKILLHNFEVSQTETAPIASFSSLPPWIHFDYENQVLSIECKDQNDLGKYTLYSMASGKIPVEAFNSIPFPEEVHAEDMLTLLISLGYMDNQQFLTASFPTTHDKFLMPSQHWDYEAKIYHILQSYRIETFTDFEILSSLKLSQSSTRNFQITSPSNSSVKVGIKLHNSETKFLQKIYSTVQPVISEQKSRLTIEGPLDLINQALKDLVINLDNNTTTNASFSGEITINDKMNPIMHQVYNNISAYFSKNAAPAVNSSHRYTLQEQIDQNTLFTGQSFTIQISPKTFMDAHSEILSYALIQPASNTKGSLPPSWLILQDGLTIKGTPPEEFWHREVHLILVVKNEFKQIEVPFVLKIQISMLFAAKLFGKYATYIFGIVGLFISANRIYSILMKKKTRHGKDFYVTVGEEITSSMIFPIKFIREERIEGDLILKKLLLSGEKLDAAQIKEAIKERVDSMNKKDQDMLKLYFQGDSGKNRVEQYIRNKLIIKQLDLKEEKATKDLFEKVKEDWVKFTEYENGSLKINEAYVENLLEQVQEIKKDLKDEALTLLPEINSELLKKALLVYVGGKHEIDYLERKTDIQFKMKTQRNFLWRFLKKDLERISYSERSRMVYGINYRIQESALYVSGVPDEDLDGKILVVQIISKHQLILKELWIHGTSKSAVNVDKKRASYKAPPQMHEQSSYNIF